MKLLYSTVLLMILLTACSKKSGPSPITTPTVTINGTAYTTVIIGKQTWMSEDYTSTDTVSFMGAKFYTYAQAMAISLPTGWRLPTQTDFNNLMTSAGGTLDPFVGAVTKAHALALMATTGWTINFGTDSLGFHAKGIGYATSGPPLSYEGYQTDNIFWCATTTTNLYGRQTLIIQQLLGDPVSAYPATVGLLPFVATDYASVRFVKDN